MTIGCSNGFTYSAVALLRSHCSGALARGEPRASVGPLLTSYVQLCIVTWVHWCPGFHFTLLCRILQVFAQFLGNLVLSFKQTFFILLSYLFPVSLVQSIQTLSQVQLRTAWRCSCVQLGNAVEYSMETNTAWRRVQLRNAVECSLEVLRYQAPCAAILLRLLLHLRRSLFADDETRPFPRLQRPHRSPSQQAGHAAS